MKIKLLLLLLMFAILSMASECDGGVSTPQPSELRCVGVQCVVVTVEVVCPTTHATDMECIMVTPTP